jgi:hypothetical protein
MTTMHRSGMIAAAAAMITLAASATAAATPPTGLASQLLVRGAAGEFRLADRDMRFFLGAGEPTDIALVRATLQPGGSTGWHTHEGQSMVLVEKGVLTSQQARHRRCVTKSFGAGKGFEHPEGAHNFVNNGPGELVFYVTYFLPAGAAPTPIDAPAPRACS